MDPREELPDPRDPASRAEAVRRAAARRVHPHVLAAIEARTPEQARSLRALAEGAAVVTGQQAGLFGGPLYTLHKAASAIVDARALEAETGIPVAPIFWIQDEDHDFAEIAAIELLDPSGALREARVEGVSGEEGRSVADRRLGPSVDGALAGLAAAVEGGRFADEVLALHRAAYTPEASPSEAFRSLIERLFAPHGLLVVDPRHPGLRAAAEPVHRAAIERAGPIAQALAARSEVLVASGRPAPIFIRPGAPLSFVHPDGPAGPRVRVEPDGERWRPVGEGSERSWSTDELLALPASTSALLRPILQDTWLPTAAYVGGPGELAYLEQCPPLWRAFGLPVPLVVPRARVRLLDATARRLLEQLALSPDDLLAGRDALLGRLVRPPPDLPDPDALRASLVASAEQALSAHGPGLSGLDPSLSKAVEKTASAVRDAADRLADRYRRSLAARDEATAGRLDRLLVRLHPGGLPQERVHGWGPWGARFGPDALIAAILASILPFDGTVRDVALDEPRA